MEETCGEGWAEEKENAKEQIKHGTNKGLAAGFNKIFLQNPHGWKPLPCSGLVLDTYCLWEHQYPEEPLSYIALHAAPQSLCTATKN